jgi:hypothetical protein
MEEALIDLEDSTGYKRAVLWLRWVTIIVTSYIILFGRGISFPQFLHDQGGSNDRVWG